MRYCSSCTNPIKKQNKSGYCKKCRPPAKHCQQCGQIIGNSEHQCASVDLKGLRPCSECSKILCNSGWERWSTICRTCSKKQWRTIEKEKRKSLKEQFGGKCNRCDYSKCFAALHFHHLDSSEKYKYSKKGDASLKEIQQHPERFELICANCHAEEHLSDS